VGLFYNAMSPHGAGGGQYCGFGDSVTLVSLVYFSNTFLVQNIHVCRYSHTVFAVAVPVFLSAI